MVTCKVDSQSVAVPKMNSAVRDRKPSSSNSSGFRLLDSDHLESSSSVSRNSIYKLKIDLMFDDSRSMRGNRLDDPHGSHRTRSIIMYGRSELASTAGESSRSIASFLQEASESSKGLAEAAKKDVQRMSNNVQAQIEQLFTNVIKDATNSFEVICLGSLPLKDKVTSLQGLQDPLRQLYLSEVKYEKLGKGLLDICATGLRVKINNASQRNDNKVNCKENDTHITPFHNIAVWSAVKFVISEQDGGAAFLPLITDPENIDKTALFQPLSSSEHHLVSTNSAHAPIFTVVMRSSGMPRVLECHGFICKSTEDAIVIAATLYQSLMEHVSTNSHKNTKKRTPRNHNGVSCISIASSSAMTNSNYWSRSQILPSTNGRKSSFHSNNGSNIGMPTPSRSVRKKRATNALGSTNNVINEMAETSTEERKRKSHKAKRAPPIPSNASMHFGCKSNHKHICHINDAGNNNKFTYRNHHYTKKTTNNDYGATCFASSGSALTTKAASSGSSGLRCESSGDILTRVAIPRSGSFLNTGGLTRYKSRIARHNSIKLNSDNAGSNNCIGGDGSGSGSGCSDGGGGGGGGGSPLGFSELFNEFRLHENLHSLDEILYAIIDADGMSFNDLKPIYKEFLLKLAVTLTQDELFQRSKNIMRRQKKKKLKRNASQNISRKKSKNLLFSSKSLRKVFQLGQFRSCRGKPMKPSSNKEPQHKYELEPPITIGLPTSNTHALHAHYHQQQQRSRVGTSGSDVSVVCHENVFNGLNRNSSSGYVSCSECSYDSESCTCTSADRCYCSLRTEQQNNKLQRYNEHNIVLNRKFNDHNNQLIYSIANSTNRHPLISCKSDEKCYCSMVEEETQNTIEDDSGNTHSDTTWCDTDSCISASKCYCKREEQQRIRSPSVALCSHQLPQRRSSRSNACKPSEKLSLDYELFTVGANSKPVQPHEALSVKKSVEAAAIFADVKLSQTTDIKSLCAARNGQALMQKTKLRTNSSCRSYASSKKSTSYGKRESFSIDRNHRHNAISELSENAAQKSCSADDLLSKLNAMEHATHSMASISSATSKSRKSSYQSMRAVNASLEDTLGYLP